MTTEQLKLITCTVEGFLVKNLVFKPLDNIIIGLVEDAFIRKTYAVQWKKNGSPTNKFKGIKELYLKIPVFNVTVDTAT